MSVVMKFGGTSVADADAVGRLAAIVRHQIDSQQKSDRPPVVVVSALSKVTDALIRTASLAERGDGAASCSIVTSASRQP